MEAPPWASGRLYYEGVVDDLEKTLELHRKATVTTFGTRTSFKSSTNECNKENRSDVKDIDGQKTEEKEVRGGVPKIFWSHKLGSLNVELENTPFMVTEHRKLDCQFGLHYYKKRSKQSLKVHLQGSCKVGCAAHMSLKNITLFPEYAVSSDVACKLSKKQLRKERERKMAQLRHDLAHLKLVQKANKYFVSLPTQEAHQSHPVGPGVVGFAQKMHPKVADKICELVSEGTTQVPEIKRILRNYVVHTLCPDSLPSQSDRSYFPTNCDISNHVYLAKKSLELSKLDQENLEKKIPKWKASSPKSRFYFRPYVEVKVEESDETASHSPSSQHTLPGHFHGNFAGDEQHLAGANGNYSQTLLYVHQEEWQQRLMEMYGSKMSLIDATYKTTRYDLALFFIAVRTNVGYIIVAEFVTQSETASEIGEALALLKQWNPRWNPNYFMSDYSDAELGAIEQTFPHCKVYLCDFHREQAWERWVRERKHGLSVSDGDVLLSLLRNCAWAPPARNGEVQPDHNYREAENILKGSAVWRENQAVQEWLNAKWLSIPERWARAFRDDEYHAAVNTNNGVEALNRVLKYSFLPRRKKATSLSGLITVLVEAYLPESYQKYLFLNYKQSSSYRSYKEFVPDYLHGRPRATILHCLDRKANSSKYTASDIEVIDSDKGLFTVNGSGDKKYRIDFGTETGMPSCSCPDWRQWNLPCKHMFALFQLVPEWNWYKFPKSYLDSPYLSADNAALAAYFEEGGIATAQLDEPALNLDEPEPNLDEEQGEDNSTNCQWSEIPRKSKGFVQELRSEGQRVRTSLKVLESLTYNSTNPEQLHHLNTQIEAITSQFKSTLPATEGLVVRPLIQQRTGKWTRQLLQKYGKLRLYQKRGRKKGNWKYQNRVGMKADICRKMNKTLRGETSTLPSYDHKWEQEEDDTNSINSQIKVKSELQAGSDTKPSARRGIKRPWCECTGCVRDDCGDCKSCIDMPKFGGPGRKKKRCIHRQCLNKKQPERTSIVHIQKTIGRLQSITAALHQDPGQARLVTSGVQLPQISAHELHTDQQTKPTETYQDTFTKPVVPDYSAHVCSGGDEDGDDYDTELVAFQIKIAAILFDISIHGNLWKQPLLTQPPLTPEYMATQDELKKAARNLDFMATDGNCLYRAISKILCGKQKYHPQVRTFLADFVEWNSCLFKNHFNGETSTAYCRRIRRNGEWGSQIELIAVATILQVPVFLFSQQEDGTRKWIRYEPKNTNDVNMDFHPRLEQLREIIIPLSFRIELCQSQNRSHFDRICSLNPLSVPEEPVPKPTDSFLYTY